MNAWICELNGSSCERVRGESLSAGRESARAHLRVLLEHRSWCAGPPDVELGTTRVRLCECEDPTVSDHFELRVIRRRAMQRNGVLQRADAAGLGEAPVGRGDARDARRGGDLRLVYPELGEVPGAVGVLDGRRVHRVEVRVVVRVRGGGDEAREVDEVRGLLDGGAAADLLVPPAELARVLVRHVVPRVDGHGDDAVLVHQRADAADAAQVPQHVADADLGPARGALRLEQVRQLVRLARRDALRRDRLLDQHRLGAVQEARLLPELVLEVSTWEHRPAEVRRDADDQQREVLRWRRLDVRRDERVGPGVLQLGILRRRRAPLLQPLLRALHVRVHNGHHAQARAEQLLQPPRMVPGALGRAKGDLPRADQHHVEEVWRSAHAVGLLKGSLSDSLTLRMASFVRCARRC